MLTEEQKINLAKLDTETLIEIMHECAETLGLVSIDEYCKILCMKRRNVYYQVKSGKIKSVNIANHLFPIINTQ